MSPIVFEINEDKMYKDKCCGESYVIFFLVMLKKKCRTSKHFAGPVDARCYWSFQGQYHFELALRPGLLRCVEKICYYPCFGVVMRCQVLDKNTTTIFHLEILRYI